MLQSDSGSNFGNVNSPVDLQRVGIPIIVIYSILLGIFVLVLVIFFFLERRKRLRVVFANAKLFALFFLTLLAATRIIWICFVMWPQEIYTDFILNRVAFSVYFTALSIIVFLWADSIRNIVAVRPASPQGEFFGSKKLFITLALLNALVYLGQLGFIIAYCATDGKSNLAYDINIIGVALLSLALTTGFLLYGLRIFILASSSMMDQKAKVLVGIKTMIVVGGISCCLALRFAMFMYRPISDRFLNTILFFSSAYIIAEVIPSLLILFMFITSYLKERQQESNTTDFLSSGNKSPMSKNSNSNSKS